jgi:hypothetical protein
MAKQKIDTFRGGQSLQEIAQFDWNEKFQSVSDKSPTLTSTLVAALTSKQSKEYLGLASKPDVSAKPIIGTLLSIILYQRRPRNLTGFQELNSLQMWLAGCKRKVMLPMLFIVRNMLGRKSQQSYNYTPHNEVVGGYTGFTMSVCPSVRL